MHPHGLRYCQTHYSLLHRWNGEGYSTVKLQVDGKFVFTVIVEQKVTHGQQNLKIRRAWM